MAGVLVAVGMPSCAGLKGGREAAVEEANPYEMADNGGFSPGGFYGDPAPASAGYPSEGQTFAGYEAGGHATGPTVDLPQIAPFSEGGYSNPAPKPRAAAPAAAAPASRVGQGASGPARSPSRTTAGAAGGRVVKAVYAPGGSKAGGAKKKKATVRRVHTVKRGDTLTALAARYDVTIASIQERNELSSDLIRIGQRLIID
jgi:N-acetylmuramoyl-L-alanine amidase